MKGLDDCVIVLGERRARVGVLVDDEGMGVTVL